MEGKLQESLVYHQCTGCIELRIPRENLQVTHPVPIKVIHTGSRGCPRKVINQASLAHASAASANISQSCIGAAIGVSCSTVWWNCLCYGISIAYDNLSNAELDTVLHSFKEDRPDSGIRYAIGELRRKGLRIQRWRVIESLKRIDGIGGSLQARRRIQRRQYLSKRPNYLWHCDGHHKLIWWGIVIHGFIDGFCRTVSAVLLLSLESSVLMWEKCIHGLE